MSVQLMHPQNPRPPVRADGQVLDGEVLMCPNHTDELVGQHAHHPDHAITRPSQHRVLVKRHYCVHALRVPGEAVAAIVEEAPAVDGQHAALSASNDLWTEGGERIERGREADGRMDGKEGKQVIQTVRCAEEEEEDGWMG